MIKDIKETEPVDDFPALPTINQMENVYEKAVKTINKKKDETEFKKLSEDESEIDSGDDVIDGQKIDMNWLKKWLEVCTDSEDMQMAICQSIIKIRNG